MSTIQYIKYTNVEKSFFQDLGKFEKEPWKISKQKDMENFCKRKFEMSTIHY
jgi:hypothetical protein